MYTLIATAKLNEIGPQAWLADVLQLINDHPASRLDEPLERGNPVFSVYQTDVICYGMNLSDWIERERDGWLSKDWLPIKEIPFWSEALRKNNAAP